MEASPNEGVIAMFRSQQSVASSDVASVRHEQSGGGFLEESVCYIFADAGSPTVGIGLARERERVLSTISDQERSLKMPD